jgi:hypothetical protein
MAFVGLSLLIMGCIVAIDFFLNDDPAVKIATDVPATHPLLVPPLLEPNIEDIATVRVVRT